MDWQLRDIEGKEVVDGEVYYWVDWEPTLVPLHAKENILPGHHDIGGQKQAQMFQPQAVIANT